MRRFLFILPLIVCFWPSSAFAAIAFDNAKACFNNGGSITGTSCTMDVASGSPLIMAACELNGMTFSSVTIGGVTATQIDNQVVSGGTFTRVGDFYVVGVSGAAVPVVVNVSGSSNTYCGVQSYTNVDQSAPIDNHTTNTANSVTSLTTSLTVNTANSWLIAFGGYTNVNTNTNSGLAGAGTTRRIVGPNLNDSTPWYANFDSNGALGTGSRSLVINRGDSGQITVNLVSLKPVATATVASIAWLIRAFWWK